MPRGEEFRKRAQECYLLSTQLQHHEHRTFALDLAKAWTELAERDEGKDPGRIAPIEERRHQLRRSR